MTIVLLDNHGYRCIRNLSAACGGDNPFNDFRFRDPSSGTFTGEVLPIDFAANAASLGAEVFTPGTVAEFKSVLEHTKSLDHTSVIVVKTDREVRVPGYESWWDVAVAEVSTMPSVQAARKEYEAHRKEEKYFL